jgi:small subunit ribosomal protein S1
MSEHEHPSTQPAVAAPIDGGDDLAKQVEEAMGHQSTEDLMAAHDAPPPADHAASDDADGAAEGDSPQRIEHEIRRGRIASVRGDDVFVELPGGIGKNQGVVPLKQFERPPRVGSIMDFVVERIDEAEGLVHLSREGAITTSTWAQLAKGSIVEARVVSTNKGGLELEMVGRIRAFMPASQIDLHHVGELEPFVGQKLHAKVAEIDRRAKKVLLSRRAFLEEERIRNREKIWKELAVDQVRDGVVSSLTDYGAFVDIGGIDGLIHISDLSYTHVTKPDQVVKPGDAVRVKVLKLDEEKRRISLGLKQVAPDPWSGIESRYRVGDQVSGRILRAASFGAFVQVEEGVEALLPISELSWKRVHQVEDVVKCNDVVRLAVIALEPSKRRLTLSLKQAQGDPWAGADEKYPRHAVVDVVVKSVTDFGAFVEIQPDTGIEGLVHISELSDRRVDKVEDVAPVGSTHQCRVLELDLEQRRVRLSIKAAKEPAPAPEAASGKAAAGKKPAHRAKPANLKGGMEGAALGLGLGNLKL